MKIYINDSASLGVLLNFIIGKYLTHLYCTCVLLTESESDNFPILNYGTKINLNLTFNNETGYKAYVQMMLIKYNDGNLDDLLESGINSGCQAFVIPASSAETILNSYQKIITKCTQWFNKNYFIFTPNLSGEQPNKSTTALILNHPVIHDIPNLLIIETTTTNPNSYNLVTSKFVGQFNNTSSILMDIFYGETISFKHNRNLFLNKLSNLEKRIIKFSIFNYKPYTIWVEVPAGTGNAKILNSNEEGNLQIYGTEALMFLEFCVKYNCTYEISLDEEGEWGNIFDNNTGNGVIGAVYEGKAEVGVGALYTWYHEFHYLALSTPITQTSITVLVPRPKLLPIYLIPVLPFSSYIWLGFLVSLITAVVSLGFVTMTFGKLDHSNLDNLFYFKNSLWIMYSIYLWQSAKIINEKLSEIMIVSCTLIIALLIGNAYGGGLASVMTIPQYEPSIDTVHQLVEKNMEWGATHDAWIFSIESATKPDLAKLVSMFRTYSKETLQRRSLTSDYAFSIERLPYGHFAIGDYIEEESLEFLELMPSDIYWEYCVAMSSKTWSLLPNFNEFIMRIAQSGIQKNWELMVAMHHTNNKVQVRVLESKTKHLNNQFPVSLRPSHLLGVYVVWMIGLLISMVVFVFELMWYRRQRT